MLIFIGIPLVLYFTFDWGLGLKVKGIWLGFGIANGMLLFIFAGYLLKSDWNK